MAEIIATPETPKAFSLDQQGLAPEQYTPESLLLLITTRVGVATADDVAVRCPLVDLDGEPAFVPEGDEIPVADAGLDEVVINTGKVGSIVKTTKEQATQPHVSPIISSELMRALAIKVNGALLNQIAPTAPDVLPPVGILAQGTTVATALATNLDVLIDAMADLESLPGGAATHILAHPVAYARLAKLKAATGSNTSLLGAGTDAMEKRLLSIPAIVTSSMPSGKLAIVDKRRVLSAYSPIFTDVSDQAYWSRDVVGIKATQRFGAKVNGAKAVQVINVS